MHLFVGDITEDTAQAAQAVSADAYLITQENHDHDHTGVCYTSLGDIVDLENFYNLLRSADNITLVDKDIWSDGKGKNDPYSMAWHTINYIKILEAQNKFVPTQRLSSKPCVWLAGCSTTEGVGLDFPRMRYGFRVAEELGLELVDMSKNGSSIQWSAERILHSDICANDIVIWGLTSTQRFPYYHNNELYHINHKYYEIERKWLQNYISIDELDSENLYYHNLQSIRSVENFCNKIKAGKSSQVTDDFMIIARVESLILGKSIEDAMGRSIEYVNAGADGIMIHSKEKSGEEIKEFCSKFREFNKDVPIILVPSTYNHIHESEFKEWGANIVIYANHLLRSSYPAMVKVAESILKNERSYDCSDQCMPIKEILTLIPGTK